MTIDQKLGRDFFAKKADEAAQGLLGRTITRQFKGTQINGIITEVSAWEGSTKSSSDGMLYAPGTIGVSCKFGKYLMDIATEVSGIYSCITMIGAEFDWSGRKQRVEGPGNFTEALKIDKEFDKLKVYENDLVYIEGGKMPQQEILKREKKNAPKNCLGYFYIKEIKR